MEEVASYTKPIVQLIPFASLKEFTMNSSLIWNDPATYLTALNEPSLYLIIFNILLTVPFGVYLRYYFQCSWKKDSAVYLSSDLILRMSAAECTVRLLSTPLPSV